MEDQEGENRLTSYVGKDLESDAREALLQKSKDGIDPLP